MSNAPVITLLLHDVTDDPRRSGFQQPTAHRYKHTVRQFSEYLDAIEQSGLPVTVAPDAVSPAADGPRVVLTFDDGGSAAMHTADLLEARNWRGMFFVTTDLLQKQGFLTGPQVRELHQRGHVLGSHSCSHPDVFRALSRERMQQEWSNSRSQLEQILGAPVNTASVPGGDICRNTLEEAAAAGYTQVYTSEQMTQPWRVRQSWCFGRMMMVNTTAAGALKRWLDHPIAGILPERALRFAKSQVKQVMGPFYHRMVAQRRAQHCRDQ